MRGEVTMLAALSPTSRPIAIRVERDGDLINRIANTPAVMRGMPWVYGPMDWSPAVKAGSGCVVLSNQQDACSVFELTGPRMWQSHTLFAETCRGRRAVDTGRAMVDWMIPAWADVLWGATPLGNPAARWFNRQIGAVVVAADTYDVEGDVEIFEIRHAA